MKPDMKKIHKTMLSKLLFSKSIKRRCSFELKKKKASCGKLFDSVVKSSPDNQSLNLST
jgi:hypothetical protein